MEVTPKPYFPIHGETRLSKEKQCMRVCITFHRLRQVVRQQSFPLQHCLFTQALIQTLKVFPSQQVPQAQQFAILKMALHLLKPLRYTQHRSLFPQLPT